jgi:hypothetical protein
MDGSAVPVAFSRVFMCSRDTCLESDLVRALISFRVSSSVDLCRVPVFVHFCKQNASI